MNIYEQLYDNLSKDDLVVLSELTTYNEKGEHFTQTFPREWLDRMEHCGAIIISKPTKQMYLEEYWTVELTEHAKLIGGIMNWGE